MSDPATEVKTLDRYECRACGYVYEPKKGSSQGQIPAGTAFEDLPQRWRCPVCGAAKSQFTNIGEEEGTSGFKENLRYGLGVNSLTPTQKNLLIFGGLAVGFLLLLSLYGLQ
ncbi:MAG: rubredoxin [Actinomycetota bacterium]